MSTVAQLIERGKAENAYNNSGIEGEIYWLEFFNDALRDLVDDLNIEEVYTIEVVSGQHEYDLPSDYYRLSSVFTSMGYPYKKRRSYNHFQADGYWIMNRGNKYVIDIRKPSPTNLTIVYQRYPNVLTGMSDVPEVPAVGEMALVYYAIGKSLRNNNQIGQAQEIERKYERERMKIRNAVSRGGG